ncbi:preprotein translocase subunit YajC [Nocardia yunnanensis]|uniref:Preprotein translocase subunit YajC n=1 Tax=Nocardia yunnanensis TaxID=2382165 RepID=A0A386ZAR3_9NOCA|nr:preprotein translocase subunit YajC [Nocardia yunnanensis]AYF74357.1 preprotein translocase subunit YajC [Nocardia yunnanensis]
MELLLPLLLVALLIPMFLNVRRQKQEMAKVSEMRDNLKVGDQVVTTSGLFATVVDIDTEDDTVDLEIAEDVVTTWKRTAILEIRPAATEDTEAETETVTEVAADAPAQIAEVADDAPKLTKD